MSEQPTIMKDTYKSLRGDLLAINESLATLLASVQEQPDIADERFDDWHKACTDINRQIAEDIVRVAVIGTVKSGKSTFVNSLFKGDYVKRGAGIVTSIVTRIRTGNKLKAVLFFKSWDEVNADIEQALVMFPSWENQSDNKPFDIRRAMDRQSLQSCLDGLSNDLLFIEGTRNANSLLLSLYLKGYDRVNEIVSSDSMTNEFFGENFAEHKTFVGDDALAVYLKDVELEIKLKTLDRSIEIADCQGSDSPNPLHLAMIQDYLMKTHFIVYVISSRTGVRQADVRFLSMIKKMGILGNILFVVNIDFSEHESTEDLNAIVNNVREELSLIRPEPEIFTFSALYNLLDDMSGERTKRDNLRMEHWKEEESLVSFSKQERERFGSSLNIKLTRERFSILLNNQLERMDIMSSGIKRWAAVNRELLAKDIDGASAAIKKMQNHQERMDQVKSLIKNTLTGSRADIMQSLKKDIEQFFNIREGGITEQTSTFVEQYPFTVDKYREKLTTSGFSNTLYLVFQEFKHALDTFMTETINPQIASFSRNMEENIQSSLEAVARPYRTMASEDISELNEAFNTAGIEDNSNNMNDKDILDINALKRITGLTPPSSAATLKYSAKLKTEAFIRLGLYSTVKLIKKAFKKPPKDEGEEKLRALNDGFKLMKRETEKSIIFHFENYRENFKFQYISKLLDDAATHLHQLLMERFQTYDTNIKAMENLLEKKGKDREELVSFLDRVSEDATRIQMKINTARETIKKSS
jgi:GTPase SAR1 family protein